MKLTRAFMSREKRLKLAIVENDLLVIRKILTPKELSLNDWTLGANICATGSDAYFKPMTVEGLRVVLDVVAAKGKTLGFEDALWHRSILCSTLSCGRHDLLEMLFGHPAGIVTNSEYLGGMIRAVSGSGLDAENKARYQGKLLARGYHHMPEDDRSKLMMECVDNGDVLLLRRLLDAGFDVHYQGEALLCHAAVRKNEDICGMLTCEYGADATVAARALKATGKFDVAAFLKRYKGQSVVEAQAEEIAHLRAVVEELTSTVRGLQGGGVMLDKPVLRFKKPD